MYGASNIKPYITLEEEGHDELLCGIQTGQTHDKDDMANVGVMW
jgi:hypothetical protein